MSKNKQMEIESWKNGQPKDKQRKVNKKRKNENKRSSEKREREADDISNAFPNFCVLNKEERLAFFQALTTARKNIEKRGIPTRKCFGTVHDEYLKYFDRNNQDEKKKHEEDRAIRSSFTLSDRSNQVDDIVDQRHPEEEKCPSSIISWETPRKFPPPITLEPNSWEIHESIIQIETDKLIDLFFNKKKKNQKKIDSFREQKERFKEKIVGNEGMKRKSVENYWVTQRFSNKSDTPKFDALNPEEKEEFFKILQEAHDNVIEKNQNKGCHILPIDAVLRRYLGGSEVTTVFATSQNPQTKRDLKVTVTVTSKDNERLLVNNPRLRAETPKKYKAENLYPLEVNTVESDDADGDSCQSEERKEVKKDLQVDSLSDCKIPETESPPSIPETSCTKKKIKFSENQKENQLKKGESPVMLNLQQNAHVVTDLRVDSSEKLSSGEKGTVHIIEKRSGVTEGTEEVDSLSLVSANEKISEAGVAGQSSISVDNSVEAFEEIEPEKNATSRGQNQEVSPVTVEEEMTQERLEIEEAKSETLIPEKQENGLQKKVSFFSENVEEGKSEFEGKEKFEKGEVLNERNLGEPSNGAEPRESTLNRVMIVNGDVVGKIKRLIYYLETKANKNTNLEKEYLKLLVDYADYLSKILESLILKKEKEQKQQNNNYEAPGFPRPCDNSEKTNEPAFLTCTLSVTDVKRNHQSISPPEEMPKGPSADYDSNLPVLSDSESVGSEGENRFKHRKDERERILTTKIRLLQDLLRERAEFVEGNLDDFKIIHLPEGNFVAKENPPTVKLLTEGDGEGQQGKKKKFLKALVAFCTCGKKAKKTVEEGIVENLKGEAVRVDVSRPKKKDAASAILNQSTLEVLKAAERKKIIDKYFMDP